MRNINRGSSTALLLCALILLVCCSKQKDEKKGTIEDVDRVTIVKNPIDPMYEENICNIRGR